jgi:hypothetical protein
MNLREAVESYLTSPLSKVFLALLVPLAGVPFLLPESVLPEIQWTPKAQLLLLKLAISLLLLLIGTCAILITELNARRREKESKSI